MSGAGKINSALSFNGIDQYVDIKSLWTDIKSDTVGSFSLWVKPQNGYSLLTFFGPGTAGYFFLAWDPSTNSVILRIFADGDIPVINSSTAAGSMPANTYSYLTVVQDGTKLKIYINGVEQNISYIFNVKPGAWLSSATGSITVGRMGGVNDFKGSIDDLRYYKKALASNEIRDRKSVV